MEKNKPRFEDIQPTNEEMQKNTIFANKQQKTFLTKFGVFVAFSLLFILIALTRYRQLFPTTMKSFDLEDPNLIHPEKPYTVSAQTNVVICTVIVFLVTINWFIWEHRICLFGIVSTLYLATLGACFMILLVNCTKNLAGSPRPFFLSACVPNSSMVEELKAQNSTWVNEDMSKIICTSKRSLKYRWSFPSGHSAEVKYKNSNIEFKRFPRIFSI